MELLLLAGAAVVSVLLLSKAKQSTPPPQLTAGDGNDALAEKEGGGVGIGDIAKGAGLAAAAVAGAVVGRFGGKAFAELLGVDPNSAAGIVAQVGFSGAIFIAILVNPYVGLAVLGVAILLFGILVTIDIKAREAKWRDGGFEREFEAEYEKSLQMLKENIRNSLPGLEQLPSGGGDDLVMRAVVPICDGYMRMRNFLGFMYAQKEVQNRPLFKDFYLAALYFYGNNTEFEATDWDGFVRNGGLLLHKMRGYFIGGVDRDGSLLDGSLPGLRGNSEAHVRRYCPPGDIEVTFSNVEVPKDPLYFFDFARYAVNGNPEKEVKRVLRFKDPWYDTCFRIGRYFANASAYAQWMKTEWGIGQSARSHLQAGLNAGRVAGVALEGGALEYEGMVVKFSKAPENKAGIDVLEMPPLPFPPPKPEKSKAKFDEEVELLKNPRMTLGESSVANLNKQKVTASSVSDVLKAPLFPPSGVPPLPTEYVAPVVVPSIFVTPQQYAQQVVTPPPAPPPPAPRPSVVQNPVIVAAPQKTAVQKTVFDPITGKMKVVTTYV